MAEKVDFSDFEEARIAAGLFFERMKSELDISERTYYRWKARGYVPLWAMRLVELLGGDLSAHGWQHWRIERGVLYCARLNARYHSWTPEKLLAALYAVESRADNCPVGQPLRTRLRGKAG
jgi:hypothetical protein